MATDYHAKYFAHKLTMTDNSTNRLDRVLFDASVDLNPHQIEAALFALKSPLSQGVLLADEVGLGKTVEAGLVLCQSWAERHRSILIICPASLRKQWEFELRDKFNLPVAILDTKTHREILSKGTNPWKCGKVIVCSYDFCAKHGDTIKQTGWDLVVIDEAHRLRNVWQPSSKMAAAILRATRGYKKVLLTATPLQNKIEDLYGLSTLIDDQLFGSVEAFREQYKKSQNHEDLRQRLSKFCKRTLRSDVQEFIKFTNRKLFTTEFTPTDMEHTLYEKVSRFLQREEAYSLPSRQKHLITLTVRKQLASSPHAIIKTLEAMRNRLNLLSSKKLSKHEAEDELLDELDFDPDLLQAYSEDQEDWEETSEESPKADGREEINPEHLKQEVDELNSCLKLLQDLNVDTKLSHLKNALQTGFAEMRKLGAKHKAVIFTESRRTQEYLERFLVSEGYGGKIVLFNGVNSNPSTSDFYAKWLIKNHSKGRITGSKAIDIRTALIEAFRDDAEILIATEAAAEGINLQFCSLVINYDLPWNPQRIEQRIGRCHRYGQKFDVVVVNFLNKRNHADLRVHELLSEKFNLFSGVFGVSDHVLGSIVSGVDFEKRILEMYQSCRTPQEIELALAKLREEMKEPLNERLAETQKKLLENFDYDIHSKFRNSIEGTRDRLGHLEKTFWGLSKHLLRDKAIFNEDALSFHLTNSPLPEVANGIYHLIQKNKEFISSDFLYRLSHPLAEHLIKAASDFICPTAELTFNISTHPVRIAAVERLKGKHGWLSLNHLRIEAFDCRDYLLFSGFDSCGRPLDMDTCEKLFLCQALVTRNEVDIGFDAARLKDDIECLHSATIAKNREANREHYNDKEEQFSRWAHDNTIPIEKDIKFINTQIQEIQRQKRLAETVQERKQYEEDQRALEAKRKQMRRQLEDKEDEHTKMREEMIEKFDAEINQKATHKHLFTISWRVV